MKVKIVTYAILVSLFNIVSRLFSTNTRHTTTLEYGTRLQYDEKQVIRDGAYKNVTSKPYKYHASSLADITMFRVFGCAKHEDDCQFDKPKETSPSEKVIPAVQHSN